MMRIVMLAGILAASAYAANAQDTSGNSEAGRVYARQVCSPCHAVTAEQAAQRRIVIAPDFQTIANTSGMTATALRAFLLTPHPKMPNLILTPEQSDDVIAFVAEPTRPPTAGSKTLTTGDGGHRCKWPRRKPESSGPATGSRPGSTERLDVADQVVDLCPRQRQIRHRAVRMR